MPKLIKIKGGYKVVHKQTGATLHTFKGKDAYSKASKIVRAGY